MPFITSGLAGASMAPGLLQLMVASLACQLIIIIFNIIIMIIRDIIII